MNDEFSKMSEDLRRVSYLIFDGRLSHAQQMLDQIKTKYIEISPVVGCFANIWDEISKIESLRDGRIKSSERALTLSLILAHNLYN